MNPKAWFLILFLLSIFTRLYSQSNEVQGLVKDMDNKPLKGVTVSMGAFKTTSDARGNFSFSVVPDGSYLLQAQALGYHSFKQHVTKKEGEPLFLTVILSDEFNKISEVHIVGRTELEEVRQQTIRAVVVDTREVADQPVSLAELMNRSPGIRIRQSGGLGNQVDVSINGFQGNSVQYFRDGIPLEYLGGGYGINNVPVNQLSRVEVYKGVVPVSLGGDALGGAINLVTQRYHGTSLEASYEVASFNTHIANLSFYHQHKSGNWFVGTDAFYNFSDNNYKADVEVVDEYANPYIVTLPLFHNGYKHYFSEIYAGLKDQNWADELRLSFAVYGIDRESQHPALMTHPYGALMVYNKGIVPSLRYQKSFGRLAVDQFFSYSATDRSRVDTIRGSFDWYGQFKERSGAIAGESPRASLSAIDFQHLTNRTNLAFEIDGRNKLEANLVYNSISRLGADPYGFRFQGTDIDVLSKEATYTKAIVGATWESKWLQERLTNQVIGKFFHFTTRGINAFLANSTTLDEYKTYANSDWGIGNAIKYNLGKHDFVRASFELTNRLPRENELFGDNDTRAPNFELEPERSFNVNLGYRYHANKVTTEIGAFYRKTDGMILLVPVQPPFAQYQNLDSIRGYGFDIDVAYQIVKQVRLVTNVTWQDNRMVDVAEGLHKWIEGTRLRNTPYFFANASLIGDMNGLFQPNDRFKPYVHWNFIREFYLNHIPRDKEPKGFLGLSGHAGIPVTSVVPDQHLLTLGANYFLSEQPFSIGMEVKNVLDAKLYDYYKIQRPGRSFHVKLNYHFKIKS